MKTNTQTTLDERKKVRFNITNMKFVGYEEENNLMSIVTKAKDAISNFVTHYLGIGNSSERDDSNLH